MPNANWSNPQLTSTYTNFVSEVKNRDEDLALQFDGTTSTNLPTNTIRWDSSANRWKKWNGTSWAELASTYALTALSTTGAATIGTTLGVTGAITGSSTVTGTALIPSGSSIPVNGVYLPSANSVAIATNSAQRLAIDSSGNISIPGALSTTGSNTAASFIPTSSTAPTNGVYLPAANSVAISTNGTGRLFVDASGNVGVGVASPNFSVSIYGATNSYSQYINALSGSTGSDGFLVGLDEAGSAVLRYRESGSLIFYTSDAERMRLDSSGRLGVGTSAPTALLSLVGSNTTNSQNVSFLATDASNTTFRIGHTTGSNCNIGPNTNHNLRLGAFTDSAGQATAFTPYLTLDTSGRVGIGTSSPGAALDVIGSTYIRGTSGGRKLEIGPSSAAFKIAADTASTGLELSSDFSGGYMDLQVAGSSRVYITSLGRVGIGTTSPAGPLQISNASDALVDITNTGTGLARTRYQTSSSYFQVGINDGAGSGFAGAGAYSAILWNAASTPLVFATSNTQRAQIDSSGRLLVGTSTARSNFLSSVAPRLQVEGTDTNGSSLCLTRSDAGSSSNPPFIFLTSTGGTTVGSNALVVNNTSATYFGVIQFCGTDGTKPVAAAEIASILDGTPGANDMPGRLVFSTTADGAAGPTERMRIGQNGYFKASPSGSYYAPTTSHHEFRGSTTNDIVVHFENSSATNPYGLRMLFTGAAPNDSVRYFFNFADTSATRAELKSNGGLANYSANNSNLSDRNVKKDISPAADTWNCIKEWEIVNYRYKDQPDDADLNLGVIAQQVAESCPEVITVFQEAKDDQPEKLGVKEQQMYWMAIKALQEAQARIEALEADVAQLKGA